MCLSRKYAHTESFYDARVNPYINAAACACVHVLVCMCVLVCTCLGACALFVCACVRSYTINGVHLGQPARNFLQRGVLESASCLCVRIHK